MPAVFLINQSDKKVISVAFGQNLRERKGPASPSGDKDNVTGIYMKCYRYTGNVTGVNRKCYRYIQEMLPIYTGNVTGAVYTGNVNDIC